jgi:hypothetical protein
MFKDRFGLANPFAGGSFKLQLLTNPFTDRFAKEEVEFYDLPGTYKKNGITVKQVVPRGNLEDYLNKNWRISGLKVPALWIDGDLWMSLTFMEIQSAYVALAMTEGVVGTAGLGLGYWALRAASNEEVDEVHVYEINPRVIEFFVDTFKKRPEMEKIVIHEGDVRKLARYNLKKKGPRFDMFFMDVYQTLLPEAALDDIKLFEKDMVVDEYRFWGEERVILDAFMAGGRPGNVSGLDRAFLDLWNRTPMDPDDKELEGTKLSDLYEPIAEEDYIQRVLEALYMA